MLTPLASDSSSGLKKKMIHLIVDYPQLIIAFYILLNVLVTPFNLYYTDLPDFTNPIKGFATQNTAISRNSVTVRQLEGAIKRRKNFFLNPNITESELVYWTTNFPDDKQTTNWESNVKDKRSPRLFRHQSSPECLTKSVITKGGKLIVDNQRLGSFESVQFFCKLHSLLHDLRIITKKCIEASCCEIVSILKYYQLIANSGKGQMTDICFLNHKEWKQYETKIIDCFKNDCSYVRNFKENVLPKSPEHGDISIVFLNVPKLNTIIGMEEIEIFEKELGPNLLCFELGVKEKLFLHVLVTDVPYGILGAFLVLLVLLISSRSLIYSCAVILIIFMSLNFSYFIYRTIFQIKFFPFINLLAGVLLLGVGADDAFILRENFEELKRRPQDLPMTSIILKALHKSCLSMIVTTLTTVVAVFCNFISHITAVKSFAIYSSLCLTINFLIVVSLLPAIYIYQNNYSNCIPPLAFECCSKSSIKEKIGKAWKWIIKKIEHIIEYLTTKIPCVTCIFFSCFFFMSLFTLTYKPGLHLPTGNYFQYFREDNLIEQYDLKYRSYFHSLKPVSDPILVKVLFGLKIANDAPILAPDFKANVSLISTKAINLTEYDNMRWIKNYCEDLAKNEFVSNFTAAHMASDITPTFLDHFMNTYMKQPCSDTVNPCCKSTKQPYTKATTQLCINQMFAQKKTSLSNKMADNFWIPIGRPIFLKSSTSNHTHAYRIHQCSFFTKFHFSLDYLTMKATYKEISKAIEKNLETAPNDFLKSPIIDLEQFRFYDIHSSLLYETLSSTILGLLCAFAILWLSVKNIGVTILAVLAIFDILVTTLSIMPFLNWQLNVVESTIILLTVGLSFDFVLHYAIAFTNATKNNGIPPICHSERRPSIIHSTPQLIRNQNIMKAFKDVVYPIFVSAVTTAVTGLSMSAATTLSFHQIGVFMVAVSVISCLISTLFFLSLLSLFGPTEIGEESESFNGKNSRIASPELMTPLLPSKANHRGSKPINEFRRQSSNFPIITQEYRNKMAGGQYVNRRFSSNSDEMALNLSLTKIAKSHQMIKHNSEIFIRRASLPVSHNLFNPPPKVGQKTGSGTVLHRGGGPRLPGPTPSTTQPIILESSLEV
uniref:SSD domain-containing protein n=1 Tax=Rhabditophanes sp. KR3021 TaxID=114890 RepID=A0AC35TTY4_9BILA